MMRLILEIEAKNEFLPYDYQSLLVGTLHRWLEKNNDHGLLSLYSFSNLVGGTGSVEGLTFKSGAFWQISAYDPEFIFRVIEGIEKEPLMFKSFRVQEVHIQDDPDLTEREEFELASPVLIKRKFDGNIKHILYDAPDAGQYLKETLIRKMRLVRLDDETLEIEFDRSYDKPRVKLVNYKGINNKASWCPVLIRGKAATKLFAWNVGLGNSTGIGFGAII